MMKKMTKTCAEWNLLCVDINYWNIRINKNMKLKFPVCSHIVLFVATFTLALLLPLFTLWCLSVSVNIRAVYVIHEILYYHIRLWNKSILCCCCFCFSLLFVTGCKERLGFGLFVVTLTWGGWDEADPPAAAVVWFSCCVFVGSSARLSALGPAGSAGCWTSPPPSTHRWLPCPWKTDEEEDGRH